MFVGLFLGYRGFSLLFFVLNRGGVVFCFFWGHWGFLGWFILAGHGGGDVLLWGRDFVMY